ncbi:MAG: hypothetical protein KTR32_17395 [Granulosicoccus sp.]|nr:hypothetical protein [Granulosicoccus sp.]
MKSIDQAILPLWFRTGIVCLIAATLFFSFLYRPDRNEVPLESAEVISTQAIESQSLYFKDLDGGLVSVVDAEMNREITRLRVGEDGFMRSVMRGLARERMAKGHGPEVPFQLTVWEDGLVSLIDPVTQRRVELSAFGKDNVAAFTRLLPSASKKLDAGNSSS